MFEEREGRDPPYGLRTRRDRVGRRCSSAMRRAPVRRAPVRDAAYLRCVESRCGQRCGVAWEKTGLGHL